jgi:hypothetical protein
MAGGQGQEQSMGTGKRMARSDREALQVSRSTDARRLSIAVDCIFTLQLRMFRLRSQK